MDAVSQNDTNNNVEEEGVEPNQENQPNNSKCLDKNSFLIYASHFLSSFGDRIWEFAVAIYLYYLHPCSLLLTAVYGLLTCGSLFLFGAPVGRWVDKSKRLTAARFTIVIQNACVVIGAVLVACAIYYEQDFRTVWDGYGQCFVYASIIVLAILADLASMANKIVLEKDWIVVLAQGNEQKLSNLNATMRTINLTCKIIAPFVVGHILTWFSYVDGAVFIASWNVLSGIAEYYLLHKIFSHVPELSRKRCNKVSPESNNAPLILMTTPSGDGRGQAKGEMNGNSSAAATETPNEEFEEISLVSPQSQKVDSPDVHHRHESYAKSEAFSIDKDVVVATEYGGKDDKSCKSCDGWKKFFSHPVKFAGLGLASLYMTVLSFDSVTIGYLSSQGVSASLVGNFSALAALIGILGSLSFPFFRRSLGKNNAGVLGFGMETFCLLFCVASIIAQGSPFNPESILRPFNASCRNANPVTQLSLPLKDLWDMHSNIFLLMGGIVFARYGLWIADLSVTQTFQEQVEESQRGVMGGVQGSLNQLMSLLKFALTIALPYPDTFGYLIFLSWFFVFLGWIFFIVYVLKNGKRRTPEVAMQCE